jgi:MFS superfamily sulfate permease-like transporter
MDGLHDIELHPDADLLPGLVVYRFDAPLIFANARTFGEEIRGIAEQHPDVRWIVIAAEPITDVDTTASDMLQELDGWLNERGISLVFAEMKDLVRRKIERYELTRTINAAHFFATLDSAVAQYVVETGAVWPDDTTDSAERDPDPRR